MTKPANQLTGGIGYLGDIEVQSGSVQKVLVSTVARTDTSAKTLGTIPAGATLYALEIVGATGSDAGSTATISVAKSGGNGHDYLNGFSVASSAGVGQYQPSAATLPVASLASAITVTGIYAESGTASSTGGPWVVAISYITV